jgi:hypothetical protein
MFTLFSLTFGTMFGRSTALETFLMCSFYKLTFSRITSFCFRALTLVFGKSARLDLMPNELDFDPRTKMALLLNEVLPYFPYFPLFLTFRTIREFLFFCHGPVDKWTPSKRSSFFWDPKTLMYDVYSFLSHIWGRVWKINNVRNLLVVFILQTFV